jgi:hypothetical protein
MILYLHATQSASISLVFVIVLQKFEKIKEMVEYKELWEHLKKDKIIQVVGPAHEGQNHSGYTS